MVRAVIRFSAVVHPTAHDYAAEARFITDGLPPILQAVTPLCQYRFLSRHTTETGAGDAVWLVCKPRRGRTRQLLAAGRAALHAAVAAGHASSVEFVRELTDASALAEQNKGIRGVPHLVPYPTCWRYLDAATTVALELLARPAADNAPLAESRQAPCGPKAKVAVGAHLAHFLWNALGLPEQSL